MEPRPGLGNVREDLRERGYLSHGLDRFLLQDAYKPKRPGPAVLVLALRVAAVAGPALALVGALVLAVLNGNLASSPFDLLFLFLHLLVPLALGAFAGFLALAGLLVLVLRLYPVRRIETLARSVAVAAGALVAFAVFTRLRDLEVQGVWPVVAAALTAAVVVAAFVQVVDAGLLSFAIRLTRSAPAGRPLGPWWGVGATLGLAVLLVLPIALAVRGAAPEAPVSLPSAPGERVLLVGIDGVLSGEIEYLLSRGELPALRGLLDDGGRMLAYRRPAGPPA
ncbi:MAG TPA: hypothetical protein VHQ65_03795, partial [Thermoanaerobaculia bacterium]|nr:hypothetical protein [Thermoanaerobaculia bacterium]